MDVSEPYYIGVDVGTSSVRAGLISHDGRVIRRAVCATAVLTPTPDHFEQSSADVWQAVCSTVREVTQSCDAAQVKGIGFDATCSLVVLDRDCKPVSVTTKDVAGSGLQKGSFSENEVQSGDGKGAKEAVGSDSASGNVCDVIMWLDHRAEEEAALINRTNHELLKYVGGAVSLEMEMPKILWLKNKHPDAWKKAYHFFDLPDFLTWRATGSFSRSLCSLVCKWCYDASKGENHGWNDGFLSQIGLGELAEDKNRIGVTVLKPGEPVGSGLSTEAAEELGLPPSTPVSSSLIDAHCGAIGLLTAHPPSLPSPDITSRLALICGTSTCHMLMSREALFVPGVWGPYYSAAVPGLWLAEGGQSATGAALDRILEGHPGRDSAIEMASKLGEIETSVKNRTGNSSDCLYEALELLAHKMATDKGVPTQELTNDLHIYPDYHGNRSPLADPTLRGMVSGLSLDTSHTDLTRLYIATVQSLAYGARRVVERLRESGHRPTAVYVCGGLARSNLFVQSLADALRLPIIQPTETESVLVGGGLIAMAAASKRHLGDITEEVRGGGNVVMVDVGAASYHDRKYKVYMKMAEDQYSYREMMMK